MANRLKPFFSGRSLLKSAFRLWDRYWFAPAPLFNLAMCRIVVVAFQLGYLFVRDYHSAVLSRGSIPNVEFTPLPIFQLMNGLFPWEQPPGAVASAVFFMTVISGFLSLIGWHCRLGLTLFALGNLYIQTYLYSFGSVHHSEALLILTLLLLAIAPSGQTFSLDDLLRRLKQNTRQQRFQPFSILQSTHLSARWPLLLIQWLFAIIYLSAGVHKLTPKGSQLFSLDWLNGYTLQYYLLRDGLRWDIDLGVWLSQFHHLAIASSVVAVLFECTFCLVLLWPRLAWLYVPLGTMLHTGIYMAQRAPFFQFIALYAVFIPWTVAVKRINNLLNWSDETQKAKVFYSGRHSSLTRLMTVLCYFDIFGRIQYHDRETSDLQPSASFTKQLTSRSSNTGSFKLCLVEPDGLTTQDFWAVRQLIKYIPLLWLLRLLLYIPGAESAWNMCMRMPIEDK